MVEIYDKIYGQPFDDGNKEAVMTYYNFKDGKVAYQETGATKLSK